MKRKIVIVLLVAAALASNRTEAQVKNIVLVHGAFADGSGWQKVYTILKS